MSQPEAAQIRQLQIMVTALLFGAGAFLVIVAFLVITGEPRGDSGGLAPILLGAWAAVALGGLVAWPLIRNQQTALAAAALGDAGGQDDRVAACQRYSTSTIVGAALAEGTTLLAAAGGFATGHPALLGAGLLGIAAIILIFPSQQKFERFLERARGSTNRPR